MVMDTQIRVVDVNGGVPVTFALLPAWRWRTFWLPDRLWHLPLDQVRARVTLPVSLDWSPGGVERDMSKGRERARVIEIVLREGEPEDIVNYVDADDLAAAWSTIILPRELRPGWDKLIHLWPQAA